MRISAGVYNLFDEEYYQWARIRNVTRGDFYLYGYATDEGIGRYSEPGRNYRITVSVAFCAGDWAEPAAGAGNGDDGGRPLPHPTESPRPRRPEERRVGTACVRPLRSRRGQFT